MIGGPAAVAGLPRRLSCPAAGAGLPREGRWGRADTVVVPPPRYPSGQPTLLDDLARDAMDPAYLETARRRQHAPHSPSKSRRRPLLVVPALVGTGLLVVLAAHRQSTQAPAASRARSALAVDVQRRSDADAAVAHRLDELRRDSSRLRENALRTTQQGAQLAARLRALEPAVGLTPAHGPGVVVRLADATSTAPPSPGGPAGVPEAGHVLDSDLQDVANALWASGAEAIGVGGIRLTGTTAIRTAGQTVLVDFRPLTSPYDVVALGDPAALQRGLAASAVGRRLRTLRDLYGLGFAAAPALDLKLSGATVAVPRQARP